MFRAALVVLALVPVCGFGSVVYTFSDKQFVRGSFGFSVTTANFLLMDQPAPYSFGPSELSSCDTSAASNYTCARGFFGGSGNAVSVTLALSDPQQVGFGSTDYIEDFFLGASLASEGTTIGSYPGRGDFVATFTVKQLADPVPAPEPATFAGVFAGLGTIAGYAALAGFRRRKWLLSARRCK